MSRPAVFLDRDGTMIEDSGYLSRLEDLAPYPWMVDSVRALNRAGLAVVVVTNQSGIARGMLTEERLSEIHARIDELLEAGGARVTAYYYCPHHPDGTVAALARVCECRKPAPGLVARAVADLDLDVTRSFVVGDKWIDVALAQAVGAKGVLVRTGYGAEEEKRGAPGLAADAIVDNLAAASSWVIQQFNLQSAI
ncbi:MAG TPA: HAD family hydrolase [Vicinamibacterales bacterium]|jgi:D-glycero-D-manno-heptose 1,7-bisphosphate phosphatase